MPLNTWKPWATADSSVSWPEALGADDSWLAADDAALDAAGEEAALEAAAEDAVLAADADAALDVAAGALADADAAAEDAALAEELVELDAAEDEQPTAMANANAQTDATTIDLIKRENFITGSFPFTIRLMVARPRANPCKYAYTEAMKTIAKTDGSCAGETSAADVSTSPILVSACLLGEPCRYDGKATPCEDVLKLAETHELVSVCPEQLGGLPTPRTPCEIQADGRVVDVRGTDRSAAFLAGAAETVRIAKERGCTRAILKQRSPSCGTHRIYDGTFSGTLVRGVGKAAALLCEAGIETLSEDDIAHVEPTRNRPEGE